MTASRTPRRSPRSERGSVTVEMVVLAPMLMLLLLGGVHAGLAFHARSIAIAAAQTGARTAAAHTSSLTSGISAARTFATQHGDTALGGVSVTGQRTATTVTITVSGHSPALVPGLDTTISQSALLPVERITR